jgi:hypothetical protein
MSEFREPLTEALNNKDLPVKYFNGFILGLGGVDVSFVLKLNNEPILNLNLSYSLAKTLVEKLGDLLATYEESTQQRIMTTDQIDRLMLKERTQNE